MKEKNKVKQGKRNRINGAKFELLVRKDLESKGWVISKWQNNVEVSGVVYEQEKKKFNLKLVKGKCVPAKMGKFRSNQGGFPDFICYKGSKAPKDFAKRGTKNIDYLYEIIFVECKTNGYLDKVEKEKAKWYLDNNYCSVFLVASKYKEKGRVKIKYKELKFGDEK